MDDPKIIKRKPRKIIIVDETVTEIIFQKKVRWVQIRDEGSPKVYRIVRIISESSGLQLM